MTVLLSLHHPLLADETATGMRIRLSFGSDQPAVWKGKIELPRPIEPNSLRILGMSPDHVGRIYTRENRIVIDLLEPVTYGGLEFEIVGDATETIEYLLVSGTTDKDAASLTAKVELGQIAAAPHSDQSSSQRARIFLERAPGDELKFLTSRPALVYDPDEAPSFAVAVSPFGEFTDDDQQLSLKLKHLSKPAALADEAASIWQSTIDIEERGVPYPVEIDTPLSPGTYELSIDLVVPSSLPFTPPTPLASRKVQWVVIDPQPIRPFSDTPDNFDLVWESRTDSQESSPMRGRFRSLDKLNASAKRLFRNLPLGSNRNQVESVEIPSGHLQMFPLMVGQSQDLMKLEVEYRLDSDAICDLVLFDRDHPDQKFSEMTSTTVRHRLSSTGPETANCSLLFWSRSSQPVLLVRNLKSDRPIKIERLRVYRGNEEVDEFNLQTNQHRRLFTQFSADQFSRMLAVPRTLPSEPYAIDTWESFRVGGRRLIQLVKSAGYQGVVLDVNDQASSLYPSRLFHSCPASDTGVFSRWGRDPVRKDVLEMLFRQFSRNGLTLVPRLEIPEFVAAFEAVENVSRHDLRLEKKEGGLSRTYNHLNPHVEAYLTEMVLELVRRYAKHPSFGGICLKIGTHDQLIVGKNLGHNRQLINEFIAENNTSVAELSADVANDRPELNREVPPEKYRQWLTRRTTRFAIELDRKLKAECQKNLMLDFSDAYLSAAGNELFPKPGIPGSDSGLLEDVGYDVDQLTTAGIGILGSDIRSASLDLADQRLTAALKSTGSSEPPRNPQQMRRIVPRIEAANQKASPTAFENVRYEAAIPNTNQSFRQDLVESIARHDTLFYLDSFELGHRAIRNDSRRIWETFCNLPNVMFDTVTKDDAQSPVIVRKKTVGDETYLYVLNQTPWPTQVFINFSEPLFNLRNVNGDFFNGLEKNDAGGRLALELAPFDLVAGRSNQPDFKISEVQFSFPKSLPQELTQKKDRLMSKIRFLKTPLPISRDANPGFESVTAAGQPQKWTWLQADTLRVTTQTRTDSPTQRCLMIENRNAKAWGWIRSEPLPPSKTGRISVLVSMKSEQGGNTPRIRLCVEGQHQGTDYYRFGVFSSDQTLPDSARIDDTWKVFAVHFNDVPTGLSRLRVGLDVLGNGKVLVDDIRVFDRWLDAQEKEALSKTVSLAAHNIQTGDFLQAHRLMESYWLRFIQELETEPVGTPSPGDSFSNQSTSRDPSPQLP